MFFSQKKWKNSQDLSLKKLFNKKVKINNKIISSPSQKIKIDDKILVKSITEKSDKLISTKINLDVQFEDKDIIIINKPKGMVVHPGAGNYKDTLANALVYRYKKSFKY